MLHSKHAKQTIRITVSVNTRLKTQTIGHAWIKLNKNFYIHDCLVIQLLSHCLNVLLVSSECKRVRKLGEVLCDMYTTLEVSV